MLLSGLSFNHGPRESRPRSTERQSQSFRKLRSEEARVLTAQHISRILARHLVVFDWTFPKRLPIDAIPHVNSARTRRLENFEGP